MKFRIVILSLSLLFVYGVGAVGQQQLTENTMSPADGAPPGKGMLSDVNWLQGHWIGSGLGGDCEELWGKPAGGALIGAFRYVRDGKLQFTEHFVMFEENGSLTLKLKHFDAAMKGWEEKDKFVEFRLVKLEPRAAYFHGLTYRLNEDDSMDVFVVVSQKDGTKREEKFEFKRSK